MFMIWREHGFVSMTHIYLEGVPMRLARQKVTILIFFFFFFLGGGVDFSTFFFFSSTSFVSCENFQSPDMDNCTAVERAVPPVPSNVYNIFIK